MHKEPNEDRSYDILAVGCVWELSVAPIFEACLHIQGPCSARWPGTWTLMNLRGHDVAFND